MELTFAPKNILQINDARICFRNFRGEAGPYNDEGDRSFHVVIPNLEMAEELRNDTNQYGVGWNVKIKEPREQGDAPFCHMKVKVAYSERSKPKVILISNGNKIRLDEDSISMLDEIDIRSVDLDIRAFDGETRGTPFRAAYLQAIWVVQEVDRFEARMAEDEYPED